jgi:hypothetical protein
VSRFASLFKPFARWVLREELDNIRRALEDSQFDAEWYREKYRKAASRVAATAWAEMDNFGGTE